jgi:membrane protein implicated in regulation of membrane protease activity
VLDQRVTAMCWFWPALGALAVAADAATATGVTAVTGACAGAATPDATAGVWGANNPAPMTTATITLAPCIT